MSRKRQQAEPYRIKSIEQIKLLSRDQRLKRIREAKFNTFKLDASDVYIDLLTDSGTTAMSNKQWAAIMMGDESYAGSDSFKRFKKTVNEIFCKKFLIPCHQGRAAENLLFSVLVSEGSYVLNNTHFDTTRANTLLKKALAVDFPSPESFTNQDYRFKGNMDNQRLESFISEKGAEKISLVITTVTNNSVGGQPVSMSNIKETSAICKKYNIPFYFDCARFAENCYFIKTEEPGYEDMSIISIANEMFDLCDGVMMSAKKDGLVNTGGFITLDDEKLYQRLTELLIVIEGFSTYGGLAGRDIDALAVGLTEVIDFDYLDFRIDQIRYFGELMKESGMPIVEPIGGHAVFVDAGQLLPHIPDHQFPGQALAVALYVEGGVRTVELGSLMFGGTDPNTGQKFTARRELVRLALPRRVYTNSHIQYIAETAKTIFDQKEKLTGFEIKKQSAFLRHFTCELGILSKKEAATTV